jgi:hypothetical protein
VGLEFNGTGKKQTIYGSISCSVSNPDPDWRKDSIRSVDPDWIRIQKGKMKKTLKNRKKLRNFML